MNNSISIVCVLFQLILPMLVPHVKGAAENAGDKPLSGLIVISGSSAIMPIMEKAAETLRGKNSGLKFTFHPAGSLIGQRCLASGSADIACSDMQMMGDGIHSDGYQELIFALNPMHIITSQDVGLISISDEQVKAILTGKVLNWKEIGGADIPISLVRRMSFSGTRYLVDSYFLGDTPHRRDIIWADSSDEVVRTVSGTRGCIGFASASYAANQRLLVSLALNGVLPNPENVIDGTYKFASKSRIFISRTPSLGVAAFASLLRSEEFAAAIMAQGLLPLNAKEQNADMEAAAAVSPHKIPDRDGLEILGFSMAGIGLFLAGARLISSSMRKIANRRLRSLFARWTKNPVMAAAWGMLSGAVSQSGTSTGFLLVGFVVSGMIPLEKAMFILAWADVGTFLLVFLATANIKLFVLYFLAVSGILYSLDKNRRYDAMLKACMGLGLLLFGFDLIKSTALDLAGMASVQSLMVFAGNSLSYLFLLGIVLRTITQSSSTVTILCIPLLNSGILTLPQCVAMACGTSLGSAGASAVISWNLNGTSRQLIWFKCITDTASGLFLFSLLLAKPYQGQSFLISALALTGVSDVGKIAVMFLATKLLATFISIMAGKWLRILVARLSPVNFEERMSSFRYLHDQALANPESAMELASMESGRILKHLPRYLDVVRKEEALYKLKGVRSLTPAQDKTFGTGRSEEDLPADRIITEIDGIHKASMALGVEVNAFLTELLNQDMEIKSAERLIQMQNKHRTLLELATCVHELTAQMKVCSQAHELKGLCISMTEGLHFILELAVDTAFSKDPCDNEILLKITSDNGDFMEEIRKSYLKGEMTISPSARPALLHLTNHFQRAVWLLHRFAETHESD